MRTLLIVLALLLAPAVADEEGERPPKKKYLPSTAIIIRCQTRKVPMIVLVFRVGIAGPRFGGCVDGRRVVYVPPPEEGR